MIAGWQPVKAFTTLPRTMSSFLRSYLTVAIFAGAAVLLVTLMLGLGGLLRPEATPAPEYIAYESGVDPVGEGWSQSQIRYYVFALLFVMFDVEAVFIFPWAVRGRGARRLRAGRGGDLHRHPRPRPALRLAQGGPAVGLVEKGRIPKPLSYLLNQARSYSLWVYQWGLACCAIEMGAAFGSPRYDVMRLGVIPFPGVGPPGRPGGDQRDRHRQDGPADPPALRADARPEVRHLHGLCANCGGPYWDSYSVTKGVDQIIPVDVYVPGCPPRPEALLEGIVLLQQRIRKENMADRWRGDPIVVGGGSLDGGPGQAREAPEPARSPPWPRRRPPDRAEPAAARADPAPRPASRTASQGADPWLTDERRSRAGPTIRSAGRCSTPSRPSSATTWSASSWPATTSGSGSRRTAWRRAGEVCQDQLG